MGDSPTLKLETLLAEADYVKAHLLVQYLASICLQPTPGAQKLQESVHTILQQHWKAKKTSDILAKARCIDFLVFAYRSLQREQDALSVLREGLNIFEFTTMSEENKAIAYKQFGDLCLLLKFPENATKAYDVALVKMNKLDSPTQSSHLAETYFAKSKALLQQKDKIVEAAAAAIVSTHHMEQASKVKKPLPASASPMKAFYNKNLRHAYSKLTIPRKSTKSTTS